MSTRGPQLSLGDILLPSLPGTGWRMLAYLILVGRLQPTEIWVLGQGLAVETAMASAMGTVRRPSMASVKDVRCVTVDV